MSSRRWTSPAPADILAAFLQKADVAADAIDAACFGVPGPVIDQRVQPTNVDWAVDARELQAKLKLKHVHLLNDLEAMAYVVPVLRDDELLVLQKGTRNPHGNGALLAAGTGLGQALLISVDGALAAVPVGRRPRRLRAPHAARDRAPPGADPALRARPDRAHRLRARAWSTSRGSPARGAASSSADGDASDLPARITEAALEQRCPHCVEALELWISIFGAAAGNFALSGLATGGVYIGGGIPAKILPAFETPTFITAFNAKEPMDGLMRDMPVSIILNRHAGLDGTAVFANTM